MDDQRPIVLFELDCTLAFVASQNQNGTPTAIRAYPGIDRSLQELRSLADLALIHPGLPADLGRQLVLSEPLLRGFFDTNQIYGADITDAPVVAPTISVPNEAARRGVFVSSAGTSRSRAAGFGWFPCPHPRLAKGSLLGSPNMAPIVYVVARCPGATASDYPRLQQILDGLDVVPVTFRIFDDDLELHAFTHDTSVDGLTTHGFIIRDRFDTVGDADLIEIHTGALTTDEYSIYEKELRRFPYSHAEDRQADLAPELRLGTFFVLVPGDTDEIPHPPRGPHGHTVQHEPEFFPTHIPFETPFTLAPLDNVERAILSSMTAKEFTALHEPLCGAADLPGTNVRVIGRGTVHNLQLNERIVDHTVDVLRRALPAERVEKLKCADGRLYNVHAVIGGRSEAGIVILGAHIDSTIGIGKSCPSPCHEPGADDDASGIAAILYAAQVLAQLLAHKHPKRPTREIRLVLFNEEELHTKGSRDYVKQLVGDSTPVAAMMQLDMIGWRHPTEPNTFEVHGPSQDYAKMHKDLWARSSLISAGILDTLNDLKSGYSAYAAKSPAGPFTQHKSDHWHFWHSGYPACWIAERGMAYLGYNDYAGKECNPGYHSINDTKICASFAVDITRIAVATAWRIAN